MENISRVTKEEREIHLRDYWKVIWRGRWTVASIFTIIFAIVAIGTFVQTPIYRSTVTVEIQPEARRILQGQEAAGLGAQGYGWFAEEKYHNTQLEIIKSRDIAQRVIDKLGLMEHPSFKGAKDPVGLFVRRIDVEPKKDTGIVKISIEGTNPQEITEWVNAVADEYVKRNVDKAVEGIQRIVEEMLK
ncbi:MAG: Wzz/FepE/Etk N-terminal domain-containing protein, partial [Acidobacteriota bacterium]